MEKQNEGGGEDGMRRSSKITPARRGFPFLSSTNRWVGNSFLPDSDEIFFRSQAYAD
jgi:hypothetical protein